MGSTAAKLQAILSSKEEIRIAITAKGVDVSQATSLAEYPAKITAIATGGTAPGGAPVWAAPDDWIQLGIPDDNEILLLASDIFLINSFQVTCSGGYAVDWGDGITELFNSGAKAVHSYVEGTGRPCSRGYTTFKVRIYAQNGTSPITAFYIKGVAYTIDASVYNSLLWVKFGTKGLLTASGMFYDSFYSTSCSHLEKVTFPSELPNCVSFQETFKSAGSLKEVDMPSLYKSSPISFRSTFDRCYSLTHFDFNAELMNISTMEAMFYYCYGLNSVTMPNTVLGCTSFKSMFYYCVIGTFVMPIIDTPAPIDNMFTNCYLLSKVVFNSSWNNRITTHFQAFSSCLSLQVIVDYPDLVLPAFSGYNLFNGASLVTKIRVPSNSGSIVSAQSMFSGCRSLSTIENFQPMPNTSDIRAAFFSCANLKNIENLEYFGDTTSAMDLSQTYYGCMSLKSIVCRNKSTVKFNLNATAQNRASLESLLFTNPNPVSTWGGSSPQVDVQYANMDTAALNAMFTSIIATSASISGKTIRITGNAGAATCDTTIITNAGGSVVI